MPDCLLSVLQAELSSSQEAVQHLTHTVEALHHKLGTSTVRATCLQDKLQVSGLALLSLTLLVLP
jgi:hypothetical protein